MIPHSSKSTSPSPRSEKTRTEGWSSAPEGGQFTKSEQSSGEKSHSQAEKPEILDPEATEPFPPGLFRVPVPDVVFAKMPELSDSALRCLLALIRLSFRYEPEKSRWVRVEGWFTRSDVEEASGLSDQATRNGLGELESLGWADVDRSGRSHRHRLLLGVPDQRFTYVPTALLKQASDVGSGTELRVVLAVLRRTWGWTTRRADPQSGQQRAVHDRWAQFSNRQLANATGRSETAVGQAAQVLQGEWIERVRPGNGPYQYRFLPERVQDDLGDPPGQESSFSTDTANDLPPDRQKSGTPSFNRESLFRDKQRSQEKNSGGSSTEEPSPSGTDAMPADNPSRQETASERATQTSESSSKTPLADFSDLPSEKQKLAEKLSNVGIWAGRIAEVLSRFSAERIRANFELYRRRSVEQTIRKPGAWLYKAITDGYALPDSNLGGLEGSNPETPDSLPPLDHKETVGRKKRDAYVAEGVAKDRFHRCPSGRGGPDEVRFMYFDPEVGGPKRRVRPER